MFVSKHSKFILTPITEVIKEACIATRGFSPGIENYPIEEYIMHSLFLKMTGFQEQKGKCLSWDVATNDYEYRHEYFPKITGEYSSIADKNNLCKFIIKAITNQERKVNFDKNAIIRECQNEICTLLKQSNLIHNRHSDFSWLESTNFSFYEDFLPRQNILIKENTPLYNDYTQLYRERNRCAHNLRSYQENTPKLSILSKNQKSNFFYFFFILDLIDHVYIELFKTISK